MTAIDAQLAQWRAAVSRGAAVRTDDLDELESHLRAQTHDLVALGLAEDEAFLIAVKRLGTVDDVTAEFAREHQERLWKQLLLRPTDKQADSRRGVLPVIVFAVVTAVLIQVARLFADPPVKAGSVATVIAPWFVRDLSLFVLPVLTGYLAYVRRLSFRWLVGLGAVVTGLAVLVSVLPWGANSATGSLVALHLPIVLWFLVGVAYVSSRWRSSAGRMEFVRFSGEWAVYFALMCLGGGVLFALTDLIVAPISPSIASALPLWILPSGGAAAVIVAAWLVDAKKSVIENIAPVLTAIFTPLFAVMLVIASFAYLANGIGRVFDRNLLTVFDVLLLVVLALVLYGLSARDERGASRVMDVTRLVAVCAGLFLDLLVLVSLFERVGDLGLSPNRVVAVGLNLLLVVNLAGTVVITALALVGRAPIDRLERWQTRYLGVFAVWSLVVVVILPPIFGFA